VSPEALLHLPSGGALHVDAAPAGAPAVLFLHGVGGAAWSFAPQREALRAHFACFAWEGRGHGAAARVEDAGLADHYRDALEALEAVEAATRQPALIVGHSMGGLLALALACERPHAVRGVFLVDPVYAESGAIPVRIPGFLVAALRLFLSAVARSFLRDGWLGRAVSWPIFRWSFHDAEARRRTWPLQRAQVPLEYPRTLLESVDGVTGFPFQPFADLITVPTHLVDALPRKGARSRFTQVVERLRARLDERASSASIVGGHYLQLDRPAELNAQLLAFARGEPALTARSASPAPPPGSTGSGRTCSQGARSGS
jgi:pimeloyl-ACP methyl ester carboxylesterase